MQTCKQLRETEENKQGSGIYLGQYMSNLGWGRHTGVRLHRVLLGADEHGSFLPNFTQLQPVIAEHNGVRLTGLAMWQKFAAQGFCA